MFRQNIKYRNMLNKSNDHSTVKIVIHFCLIELYRNIMTIKFLIACIFIK